MATQKAGSILYNPETKLIGLVYRPRKKDISFCKGHLEEGETIEECAVRETVEETGRLCHIVKKLGVNAYVTDKGEEVENHMYLTFDDGKCMEESVDPEVCIWVDIDDVLEVLSFDDLKDFYKDVLDEIKEAV